MILRHGRVSEGPTSFSIDFRNSWYLSGFSAQNFFSSSEKTWFEPSGDLLRSWVEAKGAAIQAEPRT